MCFLFVLEAGSLRSRREQAGCWWGLSLGCADLCPCMAVPLCVCVPISSPYRNSSPLDSGSIHTASHDLGHLLGNPTSMHSPVLHSRCWDTDSKEVRFSL